MTMDSAKRQIRTTFGIALLAAAALAVGALDAASADKARAGKAAASKPLVAPAAALRLSATAQSSLKVLGDSTLHKWELKATQLEISAHLDPGSMTAWQGAQKGLLKGLSLSVQVDGLKSDEGEKLDKNTRKAMESKKFPGIRFVMSSYDLKGEDVRARGALTIHDVSKDIELTGKATETGSGISVKGSFDLLMSGYGIKPPVMMLGTIRVVDKVSIVYDFALEPVR